MSNVHASQCAFSMHDDFKIVYDIGILEGRVFPTSIEGSSGATG